MNGFDNTLDWIGAASFQLAIAAGIAWLLCATVARHVPRLKHAIWVIVLLKCFIPPATTAPWSLAQLWTPTPEPDLSHLFVEVPEPLPVGQASPDVATSAPAPHLADPNYADPKHAAPQVVSSVPQAIGEENPVAPKRQARPDRPRDVGNASVAPLAQAGPEQPRITAAEAFQQWWMGRLTVASLLFLWMLGGLAVIAIAVFSVVRIAGRVRRGQVIDEGPAAVALEEATMAMQLKRRPRLVSTSEAVTPFVVGLWRPAIVLPERVIQSLPADELRLVVWHEVVHIARHDAWTSLLQLISVTLFWFHPAVWFAAAAVRREREACCDETVLHTTNAAPSTYGDTFLHVLSAVRGRAIRTPAWAAPSGIFERDSDLRQRLEQIMSFQPGPTWKVEAGLVAAIFAMAVIPMGTRADDPWKSVDEADIPKIVSISPTRGATDVDPNMSAIEVTFDRPMAAGFSWTGGGPEFPKSPTGNNPSWSKNRTTCKLPVTLDAGRFYRIGINSKSVRNFQSTDGVPAKPTVLTFTTKGANPAAVGRMAAPKIISIIPANGATDVHPLTTKEIRVTFDQPMGTGMSWVGGGETYPPTPPDGEAHWLSNSRTCVLPVNLVREHNYQLNLNSDRFKNFQSTSGIPLEPVDYAFQTVSHAAAAIVLGDSFEAPHRDKNFVDYWGQLRTTDDAVTGKYSIRLEKLDPPVRFPSDANPEIDVTFVQNGTSYGWGEPQVIPTGTTELHISLMVKADNVDKATFEIGFMKWTPSAKAGKEKSYFTVPPVGADPSDEDGAETLLIGRLTQDDPVANHGWALYERTILVPKFAELVNCSVKLEEGEALWVDDVTILASSLEKSPEQAGPNTSPFTTLPSSDLESLQKLRVDLGAELARMQLEYTNSQDKPRELWERIQAIDKKIKSLSTESSNRTQPDAIAADTRNEPRPPSSNIEPVPGDHGILLSDDIETSLPGISKWRQQDVAGVVLSVDDEAHSGSHSLKLQKNIDGYFPIASWSQRLDHNDPNATHIQLSAMVKAEAARKAILDVLFLDADGEWIHHQWADHVGDYRNEWLATEGRLADGTDTTPEPNGVTHDWHPYGAAIAIPTGTKSIEISAQIYGPGTIWVDDVEVRYVTPES